MKKLILLAVLFSLSPISFAESLTPMNKSAATMELSDKTITTISAATLDGKVISDSFTGYFGKDGKMTGKFANKPAEGPQNDQGSWKVQSDGKVCVTWDHWNNAKEKCVSFYKLNNALLIVNASNGFESLILNTDMKSGNKM
ncbi:MAG TPA: hypothetical protein VLI69_06275 [Gammaproteobacteria bacterium]|nr:hypothetical protein [Gammaproteobacteria bacterium]